MNCIVILTVNYKNYFLNKLQYIIMSTTNYIIMPPISYTSMLALDCTMILAGNAVIMPVAGAIPSCQQELYGCTSRKYTNMHIWDAYRGRKITTNSCQQAILQSCQNCAIQLEQTTNSCYQAILQSCQNYVMHHARRRLRNNPCNIHTIMPHNHINWNCLRYKRNV